MSTIDSNFFEIQRRGYLWKSDSTLDDGETPLGWSINPNLCAANSSDGETKLRSMPIGAFFLCDDGTLYYKNAMPNFWNNLGISDGALDRNIDMGNPWTINQINENLELVIDAGTPAQLAEVLNG